MEKVVLLVLLVPMCACSKSPTIPVPKSTSCLEYGQRVIWDDQFLQNFDLGSHFKSALADGLADHSLRLCGYGERSGYRLTVTEVRTKYHDAGMRPSLIPSGNVLWDVASGVFAWTVTSGVKKVYRAVAGVDYKIEYSAALSHGGKTCWLVRNDRPHFKLMDEDMVANLRKHYTNFAGEVVAEIARLHAK